MSLKNKANIDHFAHQVHTKKSGGVGPHKNKKKVIERKSKYKPNYLTQSFMTAYKQNAFNRKRFIFDLNHRKSTNGHESLYKHHNVCYN